MMHEGMYHIPHLYVWMTVVYVAGYMTRLILNWL